MPQEYLLARERNTSLKLLMIVVLVGVCLLLRTELAKSSVQTGQQTCSEGWYITGYYAPREDELPDAAEQISVERTGDLSFSQKFLNEIRTEGWAITRFGWALGYYSF